jgi:hypothetical protein
MLRELKKRLQIDGSNEDSVVGTAANGVGTLIGNVFAAPFRAVFSASCE